MPLDPDIKNQAVTKLGDYAMKLDNACGLLCFVVDDDGLTVDAYAVGNAMALIGAGGLVIDGMRQELLEGYTMGDGDQRDEEG